MFALNPTYIKAITYFPKQVHKFPCGTVQCMHTLKLLTLQVLEKKGINNCSPDVSTTRPKTFREKLAT